MPNIPIPQYQRQVATPNINPRTDVFEAPRIYDASQGLQDLGHAVVDVVQHESQRRDVRALQDYDIKLAELDRRKLEGDEDAPGALLSEGRNAAGVTKRTLADWDREADALEPKFLSPDMQAAAKQKRAVRREDAYSRLWEHEIQQGKVADEQAATASKATYHADAVAYSDDPKMVDANIARLRGVVMDEAKRKGWDATTTAQQLGAEESGVLRDVMALKITRDPVGAMEYFEANSGRLLNSDRIAIEAALRPHVLDAAGRIQGDADWNAGSAAPPQGFDAVVTHLLKTEGGYVANDGGKGPTNFGINSTAHPDVDVSKLTPDKAREIYRTQYWEAMGIDTLPPALQAQAFDAAVNQGKGWTRRALLDAGGDPVKFAQLRRERYQQLAAQNPKQFGKDLKGWLARVDALAPGPDIHPAVTILDPAAAAANIDDREATALARADQDPNQDVRNQRMERIRYLASQERLVLREREHGMQAAKAEALDRYNNTVAKLGDGVNVPLPERPSRESLVATFGEYEGGQKFDEMQMYARVSPDVARLKTATSAEAADIIASYKPDPKGDNYVLASKLYDGLTTAFKSIQTERNANPATFLMSNSPTLQSSYTALTQAQEAAANAEGADQPKAYAAMQSKGAAFVTLMLSEQARLGVPLKNRAVLPKAAVLAIHDEFNQHMDKGDVAGAVGVMRQALLPFGAGAVHVIPQLGKDQGMVGRMALEGIDDRTIQTYAVGAAAGDKELEKGVGTANWNKIKAAVRSNLAALDATGTSEWSTYFDASVTLAAQKMRQLGALGDPDTVAAQATGELINDRYVFAGMGDQVSYRVPRADIQGRPIDTDAVIQGAAGTLNALTIADFSPTDPKPPGVTADEFKALRLARIQRTGVWMTSGDESGLQLGYTDDQGRTVRVLDAAGRPITKTWAELSKPRQAETNDARQARMRAGIIGAGL